MATHEKTIRTTLASSLKQFEKKKVAVYARVSREGELKHHSIEAQKTNLEQEINQRPDWIFVDFYVDEGVSGTKMNRPEFNRMVDDARNGKIDIILTKTVSRFGRNTAGVQKVLRELQELDVIVIFDNENINTDNPDSMFYLQFLGIQAEAEAKQTSDYQKWAIRSRYKEGIPNQSRPYGYVMINHQLQVVPEEAEVVKRIFAMYLSGMGTQSISRALNDDGIITQRNLKFQPLTIHHIIRNEVYTGDLLLQKSFITDYLTKRKIVNSGELPKYLVTDAHQPIIDRVTFEKVQQEIARRDKGQTGKVSRKTQRLFTGLIYCDICKKSVHYKLIRNGSPREVWICSTYDKLGAKHCPIKPIREDTLISITHQVLEEEGLVQKDSTLTHDLLNKHLRKIIVKEDQNLEFHLNNSQIIEKSWTFELRSNSWTPEMRQKARERAIAQHAKRKEEQSHE